jgi:hypothetical protein
MFSSAGCSLLRAEGFFCNLDILFGGLGIGKLQFLIKKKFNFFFSYKFFSIFGHQTPWIRIDIQPKMLDPDPYQMNTDPQPWLCLLKTLHRTFRLQGEASSQTENSSGYMQVYKSLVKNKKKIYSDI